MSNIFRSRSGPNPSGHRLASFALAAHMSPDRLARQIAEAAVERHVQAFERERAIFRERASAAPQQEEWMEEANSRYAETERSIRYGRIQFTRRLAAQLADLDIDQLGKLPSAFLQPLIDKLVGIQSPIFNFSLRRHHFERFLSFCRYVAASSCPVAYLDFALKQHFYSNSDWDRVALLAGRTDFRIRRWEGDPQRQGEVFQLALALLRSPTRKNLNALLAMAPSVYQAFKALECDCRADGEPHPKTHWKDRALNELATGEYECGVVEDIIGSLYFSGVVLARHGNQFILAKLVATVDHGQETLGIVLDIPLVLTVGGGARTFQTGLFGVGGWAGEERFYIQAYQYSESDLRYMKDAHIHHHFRPKSPVTIASNIQHELEHLEGMARSVPAHPVPALENGEYTAFLAELLFGLSHAPVLSCIASAESFSDPHREALLRIRTEMTQELGLRYASDLAARNPAYFRAAAGVLFNQAYHAAIGITYDALIDPFLVVRATG